MKAQFRTKAVLAIAALLFVVGAINGSLQATTIVYEPFDYPVPPDLNYGTQFNGTPIGAGTGLTGNWAATTGIYHPYSGYKCTIDSPTLSYGIFPGTAAKLRLTVNSGAWAYASIDPANLGGKLDDGDTLWFSAITSVSLGSPNAIDLLIGTVNGTSAGDGLGFSVNRVGSTVVQAASWVGGIKAVAPATSPVAVSAVSLVVGKITFGATDTVDIYLPDSNLTLGSSVATISAALDQTTFGSIRIQGSSGISHWIDEIRIGETYEDLIGGKHAYWDLNGNTAGAGGATPGGAWNATDPNWNDSGDGAGTGTVAWATSGQIAVFAAGTDATGTYDVTVEGTQDIGGMKFSKGTVTLSAGTGANLRMVRDSKVYVEPALTATVATPISDDGSARQLSLSGAGTLALSGDNTYTGATIVPVGTLVLSGNNVLATGGMNISGGVARFESPASINGTARNVTVNTGGAVVFGPSFGAGNIPAALLNRIAAGSTGAIAADNYAGTNFDFNTAGLASASLGAVGSVTYSGTLTPNGTTYRLGGGGGTLIVGKNAVTGSGKSLAVTGPGTVVLAAANDYDGGTTLSGVTLVVGNVAALGTGTVTVTGNSTIQAGFSGTIALEAINSDAFCTLDTQSNTVTLSSAVTGGGGLILVGNGTLLIGNNGALGTGAFTIASASATVAAEGTIVTTNPVITQSDVTIGGTGTLTLGALTFNADPLTITNNNTTGTTTFAAMTSNNNGKKALMIAGNGDTTVTGIIYTGDKTMTKKGTGTLTLCGNNSNSGGATTLIGGGTLKLNYDTAAGGTNSSKLANAQALTLSGGTVILKGGTHPEVVLSTAVNTAGTFLTRDGGTSKLQMNAITRGAGGTISFADAAIATTDTNNINGILGGWATLGNDWAKSVDTGAADTAITALALYTGALPQTGGVNTDNDTLTGSQIQSGAVLANTVKIANSGSGDTLNLGANNLTITYVSATSLGGVLYVGGGDDNYTISGSGGKILTSTTTGELIINVATGKLTISAPFVATGATAGILTKTGAGTLAISSANTFTGATKVNQGVLQLWSNTAAGTTAGGIVVQNGAALELANSAAIGAEALTLAGTGISNGGALRNIAGNTSSYAGAISMIAGGARINSDSGGTLTLSGTITTAAGNNLTIGGEGNVTASNVISGAGNLTKDGGGTGTLSGANTYTGTTTVSAGTLTLSSSGTFASSPIITVGDAGSSGAMLDVTAKGGFTVGAAQILKGIGAVNAGAANTLTIDGTLAPGNTTTNSIGALSVTGSTALGGTNDFDISKNVNVFAADKLSTSVGLTYGGTLKITSVGPDAVSTFAATNSWDLFDFPTGSYSGTFANASVFGTAGDGVNLPLLATGLKWSFDRGTGVLSVDSVAVPGDTNGDFVVDAADYIAIKTNFGLTGTGITRLQGDLIDNDVVDWDDLQTLMGIFSTRTIGEAPAVPEPCSAMLLMYGAASLLLRRRAA